MSAPVGLQRLIAAATPRRTARAMALLAACLGATAARAVERPEIEPNNTKAQADLNGPFLLSPGDSVSGVTTGTSTTTPGTGSADYFRIRTTAQPPGIYRRTLQLATVGAPGHTASLRGITQSAGVLAPTSDTSAQVSSSLTSPARTVAWYGFGREEEIYYRVVGGTMTTGPYIATLASTPVVPVVVPGTIYGGIVRISAAPVSPSTIDTDTWLYDAALNAIPGAGNDDVFGSPAGGPSSFTRTLAPGEYTLAIAPAQLSNNQSSPADDDVRNGVALDFPDAVLCSLVNGSGPSATGGVLVTIDDSFNPPATVQVSFDPATIGEVKFIRFTLLPDPNPTGACCLLSGTCVGATAAGCAAQGGVYQGDAQPCAGTVCPQQGSCCDPGGCCSVTLEVNCPPPHLWTAAGACVPSTCPPPLNDLCAGAIAVALDVPVAASNCTATSASDGPTASCQSTAGKSVWFAFTPPADGTYRVSLCGSLQDTVLTVFTTTNCTTFAQVACDDDGCDATNPPIADLASVSSVLTLLSGTTYRIRVASFGATPAGGPISLVVNAVPSGACCNLTSGACTVVFDRVCTTGVYQGDGVLCMPSPCPPPGACCRGSCCDISTQAACGLGQWTLGGACSPGACPPTANDFCADALPVPLGSPIAGDNCAATSTGDGPAPACQSNAAKGVWFSFLATHTASYRISTCGSAQDTVLQVLTSPDCSAFTLIGSNGGQGGCDDDACDGVSPPGSTLASNIGSLVLDAGGVYLIRVSSFGSAPAGGPFTLAVTANGVLGACCDGAGACTTTDEQRCPSSGAFNASITCQPSPCTPPNGACCRGATCEVVTQVACTGSNTAFVGVGSVCNTPGNPLTPCCFADFNHAGGVSVQDIFDFLAAYFNSEPTADINGGGVSVQDIFDFLAAYFAGCN